MRSSATVSTGRAKPAGRRPAGAGMSDGQDRAPDGGGSVQRAAAVRRKSRGGISGTAATTVWSYLTEFAIVGESRGRCSHAVQVASRRRQLQHSARHATPCPVRHSVFPGPARQDAGVTPRPHSLEIAVRSRGSLRLRGSLPRVSPKLGPSNGLNWGHGIEVHQGHAFGRSGPLHCTVTA